jgi:hypothetical protein
MKNEQDELLDKLFLAARSLKPDTEAAEAYFETRLLARLEEQQSNLALFQVWSWRLMPWLASIVIVVGIGTLVYDPMRSSDLSTQFTSGYEEYLTTTLLAGG